MALTEMIQAPAEVLDGATRMGAVQLTVADAARSVDFYQQVLGLQLQEQRHGWAALGVGGANLVELVEMTGARQVRNHSGLYHFAILVPSRVALAHVLRNLIQHEIQIGGSDHLVSEALYFSDPDGNGIEVYRDRPRAEWQYEKGKPILGGLPLDYQGILRELGAGSSPQQEGLQLEPTTVMGHVHLHVSNLAAAVDFYCNVVGFELIMDWNQASFISAGGYHHHLGLNTWAGVGAPPLPADAVGLRHYEIVLATREEKQRLIERLTQSGVAYEEQDNGLSVRDPAGNGILFTVSI
ncbi:MAG: VOC family protein [Caldilineaceae bacterium]|nr:VOC family protein [Caldilineaceae bacterium]